MGLSMVDFLTELAAMPRRVTTFRNRQAGSGLLVLSCAAMGVVELSSLQLLPQLHPFGDIPAFVIGLGGAAQLLCAILLMFPKRRRIAAALLAVLWCLAVVATAMNAARGPAPLPAWVPVMEGAVLFAGFLALARPESLFVATPKTALRLAFGAMLLLFGLIHISYRSAIAGMIPGWIPLESIWPFFTGGLMLLAGVAMLVDRLTKVAARLIAGLFASWIILVHLARIWSEPGSISEWEFALTALALTGTALMVARQRLDQ